MGDGTNRGSVPIRKAGAALEARHGTRASASGPGEGSIPLSCTPFLSAWHASADCQDPVSGFRRRFEGFCEEGRRGRGV